MTTRKPTSILASAILLGSSALALAGSGGKGNFPGAYCGGTGPTIEHNPLSFLDGKVVFDVQERFRWEIRENNFDFNDRVNAPTDDNWFLNRFRLGVAIKPTDWLKIYVQTQDSREINSDRPDIPGTFGAEGDESFDLRQGYVELGNVKNFPLTLKVGRQELEYGGGLLVSPGDWSNVGGRTFDAAKLRWQEKNWWLDAFTSSVAVVERGSYNQTDVFNGNETHRGQIFSGLYFSTTAIPVETIDLYVLHLHENANPKYFQNSFGDTNFFTFGLRIKSKPGAFARSEPEPQGKGSRDGKSTPPPPAPKKPVGLDYELEAAFQHGNVRGLDLTAFAVHAGAGYTFDFAWLPRLGVEYNYGSGDTDPTDRDVETFQNLFPANHPPYGIMDVFSWQNVHEAGLNLKFQPVKSVTVQAEYDSFWLASTDDFWYRSNGSTTVRPLTPAARAASDYAGSELALIVTWKVRKELTLQAGYAHFFAGGYLNATGRSDDADFGYLQTTIAF